MKATVCYKTFVQTSPDDFQSYVKIIHVEPETTIQEIADMEEFEGWKESIILQLDIPKEGT